MLPIGQKLYISSSYGNDSLATIAWAAQQNLNVLNDITVIYCDTGWADPKWAARVELGEKFARERGMRVHRTTSIGMEELVKIKKGFPGNGQQFCTAHLKGVPFLEFADEDDPLAEALVLIGKRRAESVKRRDTQEWVANSEYHGGRTLWHPLYLHSNEERDELLLQEGVSNPPADWGGTHDRLYLLPHRSEECNPCVNANRGDFMRLSGPELAKVNRLEVAIGKPMFRPKRFNGVGIYGVMMWAKYGKDSEAELSEDEGCGAPFGCGL